MNISFFIFIFKYLFIWLHWVFAAYRISFPNQGSNLGPLHSEHGVLATGPPGKSQQWTFPVQSFFSGSASTGREWLQPGVTMKLDAPYKYSQYWVFIGRTDVEAETPILWPPDAKS